MTSAQYVPKPMHISMLQPLERRTKRLKYHKVYYQFASLTLSSKSILKRLFNFRNKEEGEVGGDGIPDSALLLSQIKGKKNTLEFYHGTIFFCKSFTTW